MASMPWKPGKPGRPSVKGRDAGAPKNNLVKPQRPPRNKSIVPKKPDPKKQATPRQDGQGGKGRRLERTARRLTNGVIRDEVRDLKSQKREVNRAAQVARERTNTQYQREVAGLGYIKDEVGGYLGHLNQQGQQAFDAQGVVQNAAAAALQNQLGNIYAAGEGSATAEMARLGLTGAQGFLDEMASGQAFSQAQAAQTSANNIANTDMQQAAAGTVGNLLSGMVQGQYLSDVGASLNNKQDALFEVNTNQMDQQALVRDAIRDAQAGRKDTFFQLLTQLQQTGWAGAGKGKGGGAPKRPPAKPKDGEEVKPPKKDTPPKKAAPPKKSTPPKPKPPKVSMGPVKGSGRNGRGR